MVNGKLSKPGGSRDKGKDTGGRTSKNRGVQEGRIVNQRRGDMRMYNKIIELASMVRGTRHAGVTVRG